MRHKESPQFIKKIFFNKYENIGITENTELKW